MRVWPSPTANVMRRAFAALAVIGCLAGPLASAPPSKCRLNNQSEYASPADRTISDETRNEVRLRVLIDALDDVDIVFRGRLTSRRYLSDVTQTYVPTILEIYDRVIVLKGQMAVTATDGKAFLIREKLCNGGCPLNTLPEVWDANEGPEHIVLAMNNTLANPAEAKDRWSGKVVYSGRIDALLGPCDPHQINESAVVSLLASPNEMERLKRAYPHRTDEDKRRDQLEIGKKWLGIR